MNYSFNVEVAEKYGVDIAILLENFYFWIRKNRANERHYNDGRFWTYNSQKALSELFPFWSEQQIQRIISKAVKNGLILKGNYNKVAYDRTIWYSLTDDCLRLFGEKVVESDVESDTVSEPEMSDDVAEAIEKLQIDARVAEIFDYWNGIGIVKHRELSKSIESAIKKALKTCFVGDLKLAISRYAKAYTDPKCYYKHKWNLENFMKQGNGFWNWLDGGQIWENVSGDVGNVFLGSGVKTAIPESRAITSRESKYLAVLSIPSLKKEFYELFDSTGLDDRVRWLEDMESKVLSGEIKA